MKYILGLIGVILLSGSVYAQSFSYGTTSGSVVVTCATGVCYRDVVPVCESNSKTPAETVECKLDYWKKEVERLQKDKANIEEQITKAQERVQAFTDAKRK